MKPSPQFRSCLSLLLLLPALTGSGVWAQPAGPKQPGAHPVPLTVRLRLGGKSVLAAKDIAFSTFPGGRRCAYTYTGVRNPRTIQYLQKLGFRTTLYVGAKTPAERVKALEDAGAEIGMAQGIGYGSPHRAVQVNYDIAAADRLALKKKCIGPVICSTVNIGNYPSSRALYYFAAARSPDYARGYGAVYHDSNFRFLYHPSPVVKYLLYLGRGPGEPRTMVAKHDSAGKSGRKAPNERLFYRLLANQFRVALRLVEAGKFVKFRIRDFKQADLEEMGRIIGKYGKHHLIWHATEGEVGAYSYLKAKSRVAEVKRIGAGEVEVTVALAGDVFPPHLLAPLSLKLPSGVEVTSAGIGRISCEVVEQSDGPHVVVPVGRALRDGCEMALETSAPDMTVPDRMPVTLTVRNTSGEPLADGRLEWVGDAGISGAEGMTVTGGTDTPFTLPPAGEHKIKAVVRTLSGARFGLTPILAKVTATVGGRRRVFLEGFEIVVAPLVALRQDPYNRFPLAKGRRQDFLVHVDNRSRFLAHKAGPCKGVVTFKLPAGMAAVPAEQPFELKQNDVRTLTFTIRNNQWGKDPVWVRPVVRLGGAKTIFETPYPGTRVYRDEKHLAASGVNGQGLLAYWSCGDKKGGLGAGLDLAAGSKGFWGAATYPPPVIGVKGMCMPGHTSASESGTAFASFKNIDHRRGTVLCWVRREPRKANENGYVPRRADTWKVGATAMVGSRGEGLFGYFVKPQKIASSQSGIALRRYRRWKDKDGYLEALYQCMGGRIYHVQAPFEWAARWRHVGVLWDARARRLEVYLDGKLASGKLHCNGKPVVAGGHGDTEWRGSPWNDATHRNDIFTPLHGYDGAWNGTQRDEFHIYARPLTPAEIRKNMADARK